jgi:hypothetical protein
MATSTLHDTTLRATVLDALQHSASGFDRDTLRTNRPLQLQVTLGPAGWDGFLADLQARARVRIPAREREQLVTLDDITACLARRRPSRRPAVD